MEKIKQNYFVPGRIIWAIAVIGVIVFQALPGPRPLDDSYITFRYARNISSGVGFVYNPGELVQGTTTPLYTLLLAFLSALFGPEKLPFLSFGIALITDVLNTWLLFRIAKKFLHHELTALILAIVFLLQPLRLNVSGGGMETSLFIALLLAMYDRYFIGSKIYSSAIFGALAILTRPDAVLAVGPVLIYAFRKNRASALKASLLGAAILAPWLVWATWYFGSPIPYSITAKITSYQNYTPGATLILVLTFLGTGTVGPYRDLILIFPGLVIALFLTIIGFPYFRKANPESFVIISYPFLYFFVMIVQRAPLFFSWYYLPLMPGLLLLFFGAFQKLFSQSPLIKKPYQLPILYGSCALILLVIPMLMMHFWPGWADSRQIEMLYEEASSYVHDQTTDKLVYAPDIGVIGWNLEQAIILDPIGLVSPISVHYAKQYKGADLATKKLVQDLKPDFVIAREGFISTLTNDLDFHEGYHLIWQKSVILNQEQKVVIYKRK